MKVFAIGDLHLSGGADKPMDVFGEKWGNHFERIADAWQDEVSDEDLVLIPGDISWAMRLEDAAADLDALGGLNGYKIITRGNHDYWWSSLSKVRSVLPEGMFAIQNDSVTLGGVCVAGSRGWVCPGSANFIEAEDRKIYERELVRLELSLTAAQRCAKGATLICMLHYPPFNEKRAPSGFTELFERFGAGIAIYGHLHDKACKNAFEGERGGVAYTLCSADHLDFCPKLIAQV